MKDLTHFRSEIDRIDDQIVDLLARRFEICRGVAAYKKANGVAVRLPERIAQVKGRCGERAALLGVDRDLVTTLYDMIIEQTCRMEENILDEQVTG